MKTKGLEQSDLCLGHREQRAIGWEWRDLSSYWGILVGVGLWWLMMEEDWLNGAHIRTIPLVHNPQHTPQPRRRIPMRPTLLLHVTFPASLNANLPQNVTHPYVNVLHGWEGGATPLYGTFSYSSFACWGRIPQLKAHNTRSQQVAEIRMFGASDGRTPMAVRLLLVGRVESVGGGEAYGGG
ncbi:hypothetical protein BDQ17DRAFT_1435124 [Cyathus striatus]|nr:hypothetical protein BDQ17DRAFT_1435124 [Cyathus striatus]